MARKTPKNQHQPWTKPSIDQVKKLLKSNTPTPLIAYKTGRSPNAVQKKVNSLGLSTKPVNKSPYGTAKSKTKK